MTLALAAVALLQGGCSPHPKLFADEAALLDD
jgi:hypothetical protein